MGNISVTIPVLQKDKHTAAQACIHSRKSLLRPPYKSSKICLKREAFSGVQLHKRCRERPKEGHWPLYFNYSFPIRWYETMIWYTYSVWYVIRTQRDLIYVLSVIWYMYSVWSEIHTQWVKQECGHQLTQNPLPAWQYTHLFSWGRPSHSFGGSGRCHLGSNKLGLGLGVGPVAVVHGSLLLENHQHHNGNLESIYPATQSTNQYTHNKAYTCMHIMIKINISWT